MNSSGYGGERPEIGPRTGLRTACDRPENGAIGLRTQGVTVPHTPIGVRAPFCGRRDEKVAKLSAPSRRPSQPPAERPLRAVGAACAPKTLTPRLIASAGTEWWQTQWRATKSSEIFVE